MVFAHCCAQSVGSAKRRATSVTFTCQAVEQHQYNPSLQLLLLEYLHLMRMHRMLVAEEGIGRAEACLGGETRDSATGTTVGSDREEWVFV